MKKLRKLRRTISMLLTLSLILHITNVGFIGRVEAIGGMTFRTKSSGFAWSGVNSGLSISGLIGIPLEQFSANLVNAVGSQHIRYEGHIMNLGWSSIIQGNVGMNGTAAGLVGQRLNAICIALGDLPNWNVFYRVRTIGVGWSAWKGNGQVAGEPGGNSPIEMIQIYVHPQVNLNARIFVDSTALTIKSANQHTIDAFMARFAIVYAFGVVLDYPLAAPNSALNGGSCPVGVNILSQCNASCGAWNNCNNPLGGNNTGHHQGAIRLNSLLNLTGTYTLRIVGHGICVWDTNLNPPEHRKLIYGWASPQPLKNSIVNARSSDVRLTIQHEWLHNLGVDWHCQSGPCALSKNTPVLDAICIPCDEVIRLRKINNQL